MDTLTDLLTEIRGALDVRLLQISGTTITLGTALAALLVLLGTFIVSKLVQRAIRRTLTGRGVQSESTVGLIAGLVNYAILIGGIGIALQTAGIDVGALFAAGALFAVGLGFAMQKIVENFVSGVILLSERSIRPGDVVDVEGELVKVHKVGIRATLVRNREGVEIIVPNSVLAQSSVKNYTLMDVVHRIEVAVGVVYSSDMKRVREILEKVVSEQPWKAEPEPRIFMSEFGNHSVNWHVAVWLEDPWDERLYRSQLSEAIWFAFQDAGITIAFPQLDVHFDPPVAEGLAQLGATA